MIKVDLSEIHQAFDRHLQLENNNRILFSGPFGTGKSTTLKDFFDDRPQFIVCKLTPINYSVSSNEDIFELIKYDILTEFLNFYDEELNLEKEDFTLLLRSQMFIMEKVKLMPLLSAILGMNEKIGKPAVAMLEAMQKIIKDFKAFSKEVKIDEEEDIQSFLNSINNRKGSIYEMDSESRLIFDLLTRIKSNRENSESILIIDDLDRLDPDHIFRLFNLFSANDDRAGKNKFGFDKIIFVCDIENIRKIFHGKYGEEVDFIGYIDKFYSKVPFEYDNRHLIKQHISSFIKKMNFNDSLSYFNMEKNWRFENSIRAIFTSLLDAKILNLRMLHQDVLIDLPLYYIGHNANTRSSKTFPLLVIFYILKNLLSSFEILSQKLSFLSQLYEKEVFSTNIDSRHNRENDALGVFISYCVDFIIDENEKGYSYHTMSFSFSTKYSCYIHFYQINDDYVKFKDFYKATKLEDIHSEEVHLNPYQILLDTFEICRKNNYLK